MNISKGYRKLAMMLAVVMTAGSFAWGPGAELVYGATPESRLRVVHEEHGLRTGGGAPSPAVVSFDEATRRGSIFDGQVYMRWAMQTGTEETYTLSYPLKNNRTVELVLERPNMTNPPVMDVTYRLRDGSGNLISAAGADFRVYDHNLWESDEPFVAPVPGMFPNPENYRAFVNAAGSPAFRISVPTAGHGTDLFSPPVNFTGSPTAGFSFMFEGETIHFLWTTTHFEVATSGTVPGRFYSFDLQRQPAAGGGFRSTASFFAVPQPMFTAYSNVSPSVFPGVPRGDFDDPKVLPLDLDNAIYDDETYEVPRSRTGIEAEVSPGARRQQMHVTFPRPVMWNPADSSFTLAVDARINFTLQLTAPTRAPLRRIDINDVQSPTPSVPLAGQQWLAAFADGRFVQTTETALGADFTHMHTIIIDDMEPSTIYTAEFMPLGVMAGVSPRLVHIPHGAVYTLLHYVLFENYIEVLPYNSPGEYRLYQRGLRFSTAAPETNASWASNRTATGAESVIRMPYLVDELGARYYIINFRQQDIEGVIRSQQAHARLGEGTDLESPESFRINNAARADNLRRAENDFSGHSGLITMDFTLDLGLRNLFDDILLPMPVGNELLVSYEFNRSAVPDPDPDGACGNLVSFAGLDLRIERGIDALRTVTHVTASGLDTLVTATGLTVRLDSSVTPPRYFLDGRLVLNAVSPELEGFAQLAPSPMFIYPNVYFINVMPVEATVGGTTVWDRWHASPLTSLTLNNLVPPTLPPPVNPQVSENTSAAPEDKASVVYSFTVPAAQPGQTGHFGDYIGYYQPEIPSASMSALVSLYIAARENLFTQPDADGVTFNTLSAGERAAYARMTTVGADALTVDIATDSAHRVMINALREPNSRIVRIEGIDAGTLANVISTGVSITINGLDQNQQYFFYSDIEAEIEFPAGAVLPTPAAVELYKSNISALRSITTAGVPDIPDPGDRDPVAPNPFNIRGEPGDTNVTLEWRWSGVQLDGEQVEFEILRVRGEQMTNASGDSLLADRSVFPELWANSLAPNLTVKQDAATNPNSNH
ncbi:MAG: hypothetical protein FWE68_01895, partial [Defluviitaleaceae bacterium]|nr:hypothetical protein [Defluviitaleaceae bacterium]